jgi:hypothetical protein
MSTKVMEIEYTHQPCCTVVVNCLTTGGGEGEGLGEAA